MNFFISLLLKICGVIQNHLKGGVLVIDHVYEGINLLKYFYIWLHVFKPIVELSH